jgi:hypothetical protein
MFRPPFSLWELIVQAFYVRIEFLILCLRIAGADYLALCLY